VANRHIAAVIVGLCTHGCGSGAACRAADCADGVTVWFSPSLTEVGEYEIEAEYDGVRGTCTLVVGARDGQPSGGGSGGTDAPGAVSGAGGQNPDAVLESVNCSSPAIYADRHALSVHDTPGSIEAAVFRGDDLVASGSFRPSYRTEQPNGPDCAPTCRVSNVTLSFQ
jgi:hypothetical protein